MSRILEKLADQHEERIINVLYKLEEDIIKEVKGQKSLSPAYWSIRAWKKNFPL